MPKVTFLGSGDDQWTVEARKDESVLEVAINHDIPLQHACGGFCACTTCHVKVESGMDSLSPMEDDERERLDSTAEYVETHSRLGCQTRIGDADVVVRMVNTD
jgi:2Fe-2S ferredoxin